MKYLTLTFLLLLSTCSLAEKYIYPTLDQSLISLWKASYSQESLSYQTEIDKIFQEWECVETELLEIDFPNFNPDYFVQNINILLINLQYFAKSGYKNELGETAYILLWEFNYLRDCMDIQTYSLDKLLNAHLFFKEIHYTVHDEMLGLRYWFEFIEIVEDLNEYWHKYDCLSIQHIQVHFSNIDEESHVMHKRTISECLAKFIKSLETGNRLDFELPCDDMGDAFMNLIWSHIVQVT